MSESAKQYQEFLKLASEVRLQIEILTSKVRTLEKAQENDHSKFLLTDETMAEFKKALQDLNDKYKEFMLYLDTASVFLKWSFRVVLVILSAIGWIKKSDIWQYVMDLTK